MSANAFSPYPVRCPRCNSDQLNMQEYSYCDPMMHHQPGLTESQAGHGQVSPLFLPLGFNSSIITFTWVCVPCDGKSKFKTHRPRKGVSLVEVALELVAKERA